VGQFKRITPGYAAALLGFVILAIFQAPLAQAAEPDFGGENAFRARWVEQDGLVGTNGTVRPYTWGPNVPGAAVILTESYTNSPGGVRRVLYLDKARMEINNPGNGFVTTGLAVKELVSGKRQDGDANFTQLAPSQTQVAGDPVSVNPNAPVYASFRNVVTLSGRDDRSKPNATGAVINAFISKNGGVDTIAPPESLRIGAYEDGTGHNIAGVFVDFMRQRGNVTNAANGQILGNRAVYTDDPTSNVFGLAISEPYWVNTRIAGANRTVLVQLFERRILTYNPALPNGSRVEMGNLGQHYYNWRYVENGGNIPPANTNPNACVAGSAAAEGEELAFLDKINQYRQQNGKPALTLNGQLNDSSNWMSNDMATKNYFSHTDSQGRSPFDRMRAFGYSYSAASENLYAGKASADGAFESWRNSPGHNTNMLGNYREIGIARACNANSTYKWYWTTNFGTPR
jgi:uncharacterized protein YkwD